MDHRLKVAFCVNVLLASVVSSTGAQEKRLQLSRDQQLIVAAYELDVARVKQLLNDGADVNAQFGKYDEHVFRDKRTLGYSHIGSRKWTALQAVANSNREPQPERETENTSEAREQALAELKKIEPKLIKERDDRRLAIAKILIAAGAKLDLDDGHGATALYSAVYLGYDDLALLLIASNAAVNTKTGIYIDGPGDITPLHDATDSPRVLRALIDAGADVTARDTEGSTPLHRAALMASPECVDLLIKSGADVRAKDKVGRTPLYWAPEGTSGLDVDDLQKRKAEVGKLLREAGAKCKGN
ncbi:MAG: ankyrin repeat domain-containing protein [Pirellulales bacterium]